MLRSINNKLSLGLLSTVALVAPAISFAADTVGEVVKGGEGTCDSKTFYVPNVTGCSAECVEKKVIKSGGGDCIITYNNESLTIYKVIGTVVTWLTTIVGIIAVLMLIYGGLIYITSAGNKDRAENAKKIITYSVLGLIVVILARVIVSLVINTAGEAI